MPIMAYAIQRPSQNLHPKSIIGTVLITNNNLRYPASILKFISKSIVGTIPIANNSLRYPAPVKYHTNLPILHIRCYSQHLICKRYPAPIFKPTSTSIIGTIPNTNNNLRPSRRPPTQLSIRWIYYAIQLRLLI